jgi:UDPglucose 6-dehydrogenase
MKICIIGSGYVGLVTGACLAEIGHSVTCLDIDKNRINALQRGIVPIFEPALENLIHKNQRSKNIEFTDSYQQISNQNIFFICVDTPNGSNNKPNLKNLFSVCDSLAKIISTDSIVVLKSTVPLGTNTAIYSRIAKKIKQDFSIDIVSNPEFLREGSAVNDFLKPERIIIGTNSEYAKTTLKALYKPLCRKSDKIIFMSSESAELTKYSANAFLATKISFINEIAEIAEIIGADMHEIRQGIGTDSRIGKDFLYAGLGYGGSCFPKDLVALTHFQKSNNLQSLLIQATQDRNLNNITRFVNKILSSFRVQKEVSIMVWGAAFKPDTDDIRESLAIKVIEEISNKFKTVYVYDPEAGKNAKAKLAGRNNVFFTKSKYINLSKCDALVICTEWKEFWNPDFKKLQTLKQGIIFDGRNILNRSEVESKNLVYEGIGT